MERLPAEPCCEPLVGEVLLEGIDELQMSLDAGVDIQDPYFRNRVVTCYDLEAEGEELPPLIFYPIPV